LPSIIGSRRTAIPPHFAAAVVRVEADGLATAASLGAAVIVGADVGAGASVGDSVGVADGEPAEPLQAATAVPRTAVAMATTKR